jgi:energy coupling factor transporter S component ThiW
MNVRKLTVSGLLIAAGVILSPIVVINLGVVKAFPIQHLINVIGAVALGPWYALANAFLISLIRVATGTGSLLAFPGSMVGALCAGLLFYKTQKIWTAVLGEVIGTGIIGALIAYPMALMLLGGTNTADFYIFLFSVSSITGAVGAGAFLKFMPLERMLDSREIGRKS